MEGWAGWIGLVRCMGRMDGWMEWRRWIMERWMDGQAEWDVWDIEIEGQDGWIDGWMDEMNRLNRLGGLAVWMDLMDVKTGRQTDIK